MFCIITTHMVRTHIEVVVPGISKALLTTCFIAQTVEESQKLLSSKDDAGYLRKIKS